jgi:thymidylate kinase
MPVERIIVIEGGDGAGKSTVINLIARFFCDRLGTEEPFDVTIFEQAYGRLPTLEEISPARVLIASEPTHSPPTGTAIRGEDGLLRSGRPYTVMDEARLYAEDRARLYKELLLRFLEANESYWIIMSRGLASSLAYQAPRLMNGENIAQAIDTILALEGNRLELSHAPHDLIILDLDPLVARQRLAGREGQDRFERDLALQQRVRGMYLAPELHKPFQDRGTSIHIINADQAPEEIASAIIRRLADSL